MDLILTGAHLIDPHSAKSGSYDIGFTGDRVSHVEKQLNVDNAKDAIDVTGKYVVPGLIDLHTHVYHGGTSLCDGSFHQWP